MKAQDLDSINKTLKEICNSSIDIDRLKLLFIQLRDEKKTPSIIKEIGHFVAHNSRDKGDIYKLHLNFVDHVMKFANGTSSLLRPVPLVITQIDFSRELEKALRMADISKVELNNYSYDLMKAVIEILSGSSLKVKSVAVSKCELFQTSESDLSRLFIRIWPIQTGTTTSISGSGGMTFGPGISIDAEILRAVSPKITDPGNSCIRITQGANTLSIQGSIITGYK